MLQWYLLNSKPYHELAVMNALRARGIDGYVPLWNPPTKRGQTCKPRPFFPSYLFAHADLELIGISGLQYLPGLRRLVSFDGRPARVSREIIDEIRRRVAALPQFGVDAVGKPLLHGDRVVINGGPFDGYEAIFDQCLSDSVRVRVLIEFLENRFRCELDSDSLIRKRA